VGWSVSASSAAWAGTERASRLAARRALERIKGLSWL
jgi:hypothetical protein